MNYRCESLNHPFKLGVFLFIFHIIIFFPLFLIFRIKPHGISMYFIGIISVLLITSLYYDKTNNNLTHHTKLGAVVSYIILLIISGVIFEFGFSSEIFYYFNFFIISIFSTFSTFMILIVLILWASLLYWLLGHPLRIKDIIN